MAIIYVTRDIERAAAGLGMPDFFILTNAHPYAQELKERYPNSIFLIESEETLDTHELLSHTEAMAIIDKLNADIVVFKTTSHIEKICSEKGWNLLNPKASSAEKIENKITQVAWLQELESLLPPHKILLTKDIVWDKKPFMIQWAHSHTGDGTLLIQSEKDLDLVRSKFPEREARVTDFIKGPMFTMNIVTTPDSILKGNLSYQITGILPFTENPWSTIGNDWSIPHTILSEAHIEKIHAMADMIGKKMQEEKWKGLFGIDVIYDEERDSLHLIEINARQPASTTYESQLQQLLRIQGSTGSTTFEAHIHALTSHTSREQLVFINDGAQILQRVIREGQTVHPEGLRAAGYTTISYPNTKTNADLLRIQSQRGIMETHMKFNTRGKHIIELLG